MRFGVSSACLYPSVTEAAVESLAKAGIKTIEVFYNSFREIEEDFNISLKRLLDAYGMQVVSVHPFSSGWEPFMFFTGYERRFEDIMEFYKRYYACMNILEATILVFHGDRKESVYPLDKSFERVYKLTEEAARWGVIVAQENVTRCRSRDPHYLLEMKRAVPNARFVLDIKQAVRSGQDPFDLARLLGNSLVHVHASDHNKEKDCLPIGKGAFDFRNFFQLLKSLDYQGDVILELYRENFGDINELISSVKNMAIYYN